MITVELNFWQTLNKITGAFTFSVINIYSRRHILDQQLALQPCCLLNSLLGLLNLLLYTSLRHQMLFRGLAIKALFLANCDGGRNSPCVVSITKSFH